MKYAVSGLAFLVSCLSTLSQTVYNFTPSTPEATIISDLSAGGSNTYNFAPGNYTQATGPWTFPCVNGNVFQGPEVPFIVGTGVSPTAILAPAFTGSNAVFVSGTNAYTVAGSGCTIRYLAAKGQDFYAYPPVSGLRFQFNAIYDIYGAVSGGGCSTCWAGFYMDNGTAQDIGYSTFEWNTFGPSCTDIDSSSTDYGGTCGGIIIGGSNVNLTVQDNNVSGQLEEFFHTLGQSATGTSGSISNGLVIQNNDLPHVHRIPIETQQGDVSNQIIQYNDSYSPYVPSYITSGISNACCIAYTGSTAPATVTSNNVIIEDTTCSFAYCLGYGIEAWGNQSQFESNLIQSVSEYTTIAFGGYSAAAPANGNSTSPVAIGNIIQGPYAGVVCENGGTLPNCTYVTGTPIYSPNSLSSTPSTQTSTRPTISPASGTHPTPQIVTVSQSAINTSSYCTTDGSSPVPDSGTTFLYAGPFYLSISGITKVRCVGMWGVGANTYGYPTGYGYVPSAVTTATYTASGGSGGCARTSSSIGTTCYTGTQTLIGNTMHSDYITIGSQPRVPVSCTFFIGAVGQVGYHVVCGLVMAPTATTEAAAPLCYGVYTESASTPSDSFVTVAMSGCGAVEPGTNLWVFENSNDDLVTLGYSDCSSSCNGGPSSGSYGSFYVTHTYNSYTGFSSSFNGQNDWQMTNFITTNPAL